MSARSAERSSSNDVQTWLDGLEKLLRVQLEAHQKLHACIARKALAIRTADMQSIQGICAEESAILKRLNENERRRVELIAHLGRLFNSHLSGRSALTITAIANHGNVHESQRVRLLGLAGQLRELLADIKAQSSIVRSAADALSRHMSGLVQTVQAALSRAALYGHRGTLQTSGATTSMLDLKS